MGYNDTVDMAHDHDLRLRIVACASQEQGENPSHWADVNIWKVAGQPGWSAAYASAKANPSIERPGREESVITDGMILGAVQAIIAEQAAAED